MNKHDVTYLIHMHKLPEQPNIQHWKHHKDSASRSNPISTFFSDFFLTFLPCIPLKMDDPVAEIPHVIHLLTQSPPSIQRATINKYFTPNASFTHPFVRTGSWSHSRVLIHCVYRWYKIMSPRIEISVQSVEDKEEEGKRKERINKK
ncbi:hypothetical protein J1614_010514 [Plenodomus biglobosus]|nr:hypothetical protein J1614_010514 [Plenodomus biglobosus]